MSRIFCFFLAVAGVHSARHALISAWSDCERVKHAAIEMRVAGVDLESLERHPRVPRSLCRLSIGITDLSFLNSSRTLFASASLSIETVVAYPDPEPLSHPRREAMAASVPRATVVSSASYRSLAAHSAALDNAVASLRSVAADSTDDILVTLGSIGDTYHARPIRYVEVGGANATTRVLVVAAQHAREWIALEVGFRLVELAADIVDRCAPRKAGASPSDQACGTSHRVAYEILMGARLVVIPCLNPDGVAYSQSDDRFWRKNREPNADGSVGTDLNRNAYTPYRDNSPASDRDPSTDTYRGTAPFSAGELRHLRDFMHSSEGSASAVSGGSGPGIAYDAFMSYHSFGKLVLYAPGDHDRYESSTEQYDTLAFHNKLALWMAEQMGEAGANKGGTVSDTCNYTHQQAYDQYVAYGDTPDWVWRRPLGREGVVKATRQIPSFTIELPPGPGCSYAASTSFSLSSRYIVPTVVENARALFWLMEWLTTFKSKVSQARGIDAATSRHREAVAVGDAATGAAPAFTHGRTAATAATPFPWGAETADPTAAVNYNPGVRTFSSSSIAEYPTTTSSVPSPFSSVPGTAPQPSTAPLAGPVSSPVTPPQPTSGSAPSAPLDSESNASAAVVAWVVSILVVILCIACCVAICVGVICLIDKKGDAFIQPAGGVGGHQPIEPVRHGIGWVGRGDEVIVGAGGAVPAGAYGPDGYTGGSSGYRETSSPAHGDGNHQLSARGSDGRSAPPSVGFTSGYRQSDSFKPYDAAPSSGGALPSPASHPHPPAVQTNWHNRPVAPFQR